MAERGRRRREGENGRSVKEEMESERGGRGEERRRREGVIEEERWEGDKSVLDEERSRNVINNCRSRTNLKVSSEKRSRDTIRGSKAKDKPGLVKVSSEKSLRLTAGQQSRRPSRRSLVVTKQEGKEAESLRTERRKVREEKEKSLRKEKSTSNIKEEGKQEQIVEKNLHAPKKSTKSRRRVSNLDLQKVKEAKETSATEAKELEAARPARPLHLPPVQPPLHLPLGQSLDTLHLNLAELSHIRKQVGFKFVDSIFFLSLFRSQALGWMRGS